MNSLDTCDGWCWPVMVRLVRRCFWLLYRTGNDGRCWVVLGRTAEVRQKISGQGRLPRAPQNFPWEGMVDGMAHETHEKHDDHVHGLECGHESVQHGDHLDYLHDGHRHSEHDGHWDECEVEEKSAP